MKNYKILLAGNPNVGKSTVFNFLTGEKQHTGNWIGKTVDTAKGEFDYLDYHYEIYDLPGTYSLSSHSKEEEVARDAICFFDYDLVVVVVDAISIERNLNLVLQILEYTPKVLLCVNLIDEARKKGIEVQKDVLSSKLGVDVVLTSARKREGMDLLLEAIYRNVTKERCGFIYPVSYSLLEDEFLFLEDLVKEREIAISPRFLVKSLLIQDVDLLDKMWDYLGFNLLDDEFFSKNLYFVKNSLKDKKMESGQILEIFSEEFAKVQKDIADSSLIYHEGKKKREKLDEILTSKKTGIPIMILMLIVVFWITIFFSNIPSGLLFDAFTKIEGLLISLFTFLRIPSGITSCLISGVYKTLTWVVSVMLPPMVIFFPCFSLLEDLGYLPRVAFNLDGIFQKCGACGKQALTMMMGFGCNAVGVTGSRIIDSKKERILSILTNSFVPCNGRFPMIIALISMFCIGSSEGILASFIKVLVLVGFVLFACGLTFLICFLLSKTLLKEERTSFTLELPPIRRPEILKTIVRSLKDKALVVLKRAIIVSIPAGLLIWALANITISSHSILYYLTNFFDPFARFIGLDGVILVAFILGFPANEIVIPIMLMAYLSTGEMQEYSSLIELKNIFVNNGWTFVTAICTILFSLFHFPCSTTTLTIYHETKSIKWTILSIILPLSIGILLCFLAKNILGFIL